MRRYTDLKWGTQNPVTLRDAEFGMVRLRAFGTHSLQDVDPANATYLYGGRTLQVMVNANTGEVVGDRPWSVPKILAAVVAGLLVVGAIVALVMLQRRPG